MSLTQNVLLSIFKIFAHFTWLSDFLISSLYNLSIHFGNRFLNCSSPKVSEAVVGVVSNNLVPGGKLVKT